MIQIYNQIFFLNIFDNSCNLITCMYDIYTEHNLHV